MEIEKNIPIPATDGRGGRKYPWAEMDIGDSFFVDECSKQKKAIIGTAAISWVKYHKNDKKFTVRDYEGGIRVWRIK